MRSVPASVLLPAAALLVLPVPALSDAHGDAVAEVKRVVEASYVNGAFNALDPDAMEAGFHPHFVIFSPDGESIRKYPIADWVDSTRKTKARPDFDPARNVWEHRFVSVDVTGYAAAVEIELSRDGSLIYTDYLSLLRFDSGWRIVAKVYYQHSEGGESMHASGPFQVRLEPLETYNQSPEAKVGRMSIDKTFEGDLAATSQGEMLSGGSPADGSAGYVAIERVTGTLEGRTGSFLLQHSGTMTPGSRELSVTVVPGSGTGELEGLAGTMDIRIEDGDHFYTFDYTLPD